MISENFQVLVATPPESIEHDTRQREIVQLSEYLSVNQTRDNGTDYVITDSNYRDEAGNAGRVYIARDANTNAVEGIYSKVDGSWTRWLIQTKDLDPTALDTMLRISDSSKIQLIYDEDSFDLGDADADGKQELQLKALSITPALLTAAVAGKGLIRNTSTDEGYKDRIDVNPDDSSLEVYDSTPDETDTATKVWKLRVKDGGVTDDMLSSVAPPVLIVTTTSISLSVSDGTSAQSASWSTPLVNQGVFVVDGEEITVPRDGWYRFDLALTLKAADGIEFTDDASRAPVEIAVSGAESGNWNTRGLMNEDAIVDTYTLIPVTMSGVVKLTTSNAFGITARLPIGIKTANEKTITLLSSTGANVLALTYIGAAS